MVTFIIIYVAIILGAFYMFLLTETDETAEFFFSLIAMGAFITLLTGIIACAITSIAG